MEKVVMVAAFFCIERNILTFLKFRVITEQQNGKVDMKC